jgi:23S rRNA (uridine2552-2'-O)-methyltransferase
MYRKYKKNEFYTGKARKEGYPARSVYKLKEIDEKFRIFKKGDKVLDLGAAPGSWLKYIFEKIGDKGLVVGIDASELRIPLSANMRFIQKNIFDLLDKDFHNLKFHSVVSDLSPSTTGIKITDEIKSLELCEKAFEVAKRSLKEDGNFVCKIFESDMTKRFFQKLASNFKIVKRFRPQAVSRDSREIYIIAKNFGG